MQEHTSQIAALARVRRSYNELSPFNVGNAGHLEFSEAIKNTAAADGDHLRLPRYFQAA
jgi:hypothetical protein